MFKVVNLANHSGFFIETINVAIYVTLRYVLRMDLHHIVAGISGVQV